MRQGTMDTAWEAEGGEKMDHEIGYVSPRRLEWEAGVTDHPPSASISWRTRAMTPAGPYYPGGGERREGISFMKKDDKLFLIIYELYLLIYLFTYLYSLLWILWMHDFKVLKSVPFMNSFWSVFYSLLMWFFCVFPACSTYFTCTLGQF